MKKNVLNLTNLGDGNRIKQGDKSKIKFQLSDGNSENLNLEGSATIYLKKRDYVYKYETEVNSNTVDLRITDIIPPGTYTVEVVASGYVFPSDNAVKIDVTPSVLGQSLTDFKSADLFEEIVLNRLQKDYADNMGALDVMFLEWPNGGHQPWPLIFSKKEYEGDDYEAWKAERTEHFQNNLNMINPQQPNEFYPFLKIMFKNIVTFPVEVEIYDIYNNDRYSIEVENNFAFPKNLLMYSMDYEITVRYIYNGKPIEHNSVKAKYVWEEPAQEE